MAEILTALLLGVGLAMDAFAVSVANGVALRRKPTAKEALWDAGAFGLAQGIMPLTGFYVGRLFYEQVSKWDHWIAFVLLALIGANMIRESAQERKEIRENGGKPVDHHFKMTAQLVLVQAIATSIDALAVGISLAFSGANIWVAVACIMGVTFLISLSGIMIGHTAGEKLGPRAETVGGIILIFIGARVLAEHLLG